MTMVDATVRLTEVIGKEASHQDDSFSLGSWNILNIHALTIFGMTVPDVDG